MEHNQRDQCLGQLSPAPRDSFAGRLETHRRETRARARASRVADGRGGAGTAPSSWKFYNLAKEHSTLSKSTNLKFLVPEIAVLNASSIPSTPMLMKVLHRPSDYGVRHGLGQQHMHIGGEPRSAHEWRLGPNFMGHRPPHGPVDAVFTMRVAAKVVLDIYLSIVGTRRPCWPMIRLCSDLPAARTK
jgi:hypothetical protein